MVQNGTAKPHAPDPPPNDALEIRNYKLDALGASLIQVAILETLLEWVNDPEISPEWLIALIETHKALSAQMRAYGAKTVGGVEIDIEATFRRVGGRRP